MNTLKITASVSRFSEVNAFIEESLKDSKFDRSSRAKALLLAEECFISLAQAAGEDGQVTVSVTRRAVRMSAKGKKVELALNPQVGHGLDAADMEDNAEVYIRSMILSANDDILTLSYRNGINSAKITVGKTARSDLMKLLIALCMGVVLGILLRFLPAGLSAGVNRFLFSPIKAVMMNALKAVAVPLVFFSLASSVSSFSDLSQMGKLGGRVTGFYFLTTVLSILASVGVFALVQPGTYGSLAAGTAAVVEVEHLDYLELLIDIVPKDIVSPILNTNMLQLIFMAILVGAATSMMGDNRARVTSFFISANELSMRVARIITSCLPAMVFVSVGSLVSQTDTSQVGAISGLFLCFLLGFIVLFIIYCLAILILGKRNPLPFMRFAFPAWLNAFSLASSNAAMSYTMEVCDRKLHIEPKLYSFSIPLGATTHKDGLAMVLMLGAFFYAKLYGVDIPLSSLPSMIFMAAVLASGTPGLPGSAIICASVLFEQFGIPLEALGFLTAIYSISDSAETAHNVLGDIVVSYIIAIRSGLLREE